MRGELRRHKRSDAVKWVIVFAAIIVLGVAVAAAITNGFTEWNPYGWFEKLTAVVRRKGTVNLKFF